MSEPEDPGVEEQSVTEEATVLTSADDLNTAARLLWAAEMETNLELMRRLTELADSWMAHASLLYHREQNG